MYIIKTIIMKKIIIPFDGGHFSKGAFSFASSLHEIKPILLIGVFLPEADYARFLFFPTSFAAPAFIAGVEDFEEEEVNNNVEKFAELCQKNLIEYRVHKDLFDSSIPQLSKETRFADLMIIGSETFYTNGIIEGTKEYLKDALHGTECPVVIVPEKFNFPSKIILAYDGSESSVFAIKQFALLFPELCNLKTNLVYGGDEEDNIPDQVLIEELAARHFTNLTITKLSSDNKNDIPNWFYWQKDSMLVSGSFGRSGLSKLFIKSFVIDIIKEYKTPVYIAHV